MPVCTTQISGTSKGKEELNNLWDVYNRTWNITISHCPTGEGRSLDSSSGWLCESLSESNTWQELLLNCPKGKDTKKYFDLCACHFNLHKRSWPGTSLLLGLHRERKRPCYQACARTRTCLQILVQVSKKQNLPLYMGPGFLCNQVLIFARHASVTLHRKLKLYVFSCI